MIGRRGIALLAAAAWGWIAPVQLQAQQAPDAVSDQAGADIVLPRPTPAYQGTLGRTIESSSPPAFAPLPEAPADAPNILLILTDDVGFGATSTFGGPIPTPTFDRLAQSGERYNRFHTTALCAPTRAALLTGRNPHKVGYGIITEMATGYPGYNSILPRSAATIGEVLRQNGYATSWFGKNHNTPEWEQSAVGPFDRWPDGLGFDYFYGFMGGATSQYDPALFENRIPIQRPADDPDYILDRHLADQAITWLRAVNTAQPGKPVLMYYAPGTSHSPHHAPPEWIARFAGQFDQGWDRMREETLARQIAQGVVPAGTQLTPRPDSIPAWDSLSADQRQLYARMMEVYAAALAHADYQMGRLLAELEAQGRLDNTLVIYIQGDNGASGEGGPTGSINDIASINGFRADLPTMLAAQDRLGGRDFYNNYPVGWAWAMNTPFQWTKQVASHLGGVRNGLVISWPKRMTAPGGVRSQYHHIADIAPTIYEAAGITPPGSVNGTEQMPIDGISMAYSFNAPAAPPQRRQQIFELQGNAAIYADGWLANTTPTRAPWDFAGPGGLPTEGSWQLYNLAEDFSQSTNLAARQPERLRAMQERFWQEAAAGQILPIDNRSFARWDTANRPSLLGDRRSFTFTPSARRITGGAFPDVSGQDWQVEAQIRVDQPQASGTIVMNGSRSVGWTLALRDGRPVFAYKPSDTPADLVVLTATDPLPPGAHRVTVRFDGGARGQPGRAELLIGDRPVASAPVPRAAPVLIPDNATIGWSFDAVAPDAAPDTPISGAAIDGVTLTLTGGAGE